MWVCFWVWWIVWRMDGRCMCFFSLVGDSGYCEWIFGCCGNCCVGLFLGGYSCLVCCIFFECVLCFFVVVCDCLVGCGLDCWVVVCILLGVWWVGGSECWRWLFCLCYVWYWFVIWCRVVGFWISSLCFVYVRWFCVVVFLCLLLVFICDWSLLLVMVVCNWAGVLWEDE